jgi:hypothetical protein
MADHRRHTRREVPVLGGLAPDVLVVDNNIDSAEASKDFRKSAGNRLRIEPSGTRKPRERPYGVAENTLARHVYW